MATEFYKLLTRPPPLKSTCHTVSPNGATVWEGSETSRVSTGIVLTKKPMCTMQCRSFSKWSQSVKSPQTYNWVGFLLPLETIPVHPTPWPHCLPAHVLGKYMPFQHLAQAHNMSKASFSYITTHGLVSNSKVVWLPAIFPRERNIIYRPMIPSSAEGTANHLDLGRRESRKQEMFKSWGAISQICMNFPCNINDKVSTKLRW